MFTVAVSSNVPVLASEEQQRFAAEHQDVLPQAPPLQPTHVDVHAGLHPGQPPPLWQPQLPAVQQNFETLWLTTVIISIWLISMAQLLSTLCQYWAKYCQSKGCVISF